VNTKKLIINADDFGHTMGTSYGIIESHLRGVVSSTTALTVSPYFIPSMVAAKALAPTLPIGVHLALTLKGAKPVLPPHIVPSLVNEAGYFWPRKEFATNVVPQQVYMEFEAQILRFLESGFYPTHLDSHHFVHGGTSEILKVTVDLAKKFKLPLRHPLKGATELAEKYPEQKTTCAMFYDFYDEGVTLSNFIALLDRVVNSEDEIFELCCHPGFIDPDILKLTDYSQTRITELEILTSDEAKAAIAERNIVLTDFRAI